MATMFPDYICEFTTSGEKEVYNFLRSSVKPQRDFLAWYSPDIEEREPDFVLLSPDSGLIIFEVKDWVIGQIIELDPKTVLLQIGNVQERRKQPLAQANGYKNRMLSLLAKFQGEVNVPVTCGAILANISRNDFLSSVFAGILDENRILFKEDIKSDSTLTRDKSGQILRQWLKDHFPPWFKFELNSRAIELLRNAIFPVARIELPQRAGYDPENFVEKIKTLDQEQEKLARNFSKGKRLISGPAGSGKTLILAHLAWYLPRMNRNVRRILIVCFNLSLAGYIRRLLARKRASMGDGLIEILPFYTLCEKILGEKLQHNEDGDYYKLIVAETLEKLNSDPQCEGRWDAILADEGQDFSEDMAKILLALLSGKGTLVIAEDVNQALYQQESGWHKLKIPDLEIFSLNQQYRSTRQIARLAAKALGISCEDVNGQDMNGEDGPPPQWLQSADDCQQINDVADAVVSLADKGCPMSEIAILYASKKMKDGAFFPEAMACALEKRGILSRWMARNAESKLGYDITTDSVSISTIHSAKGLDYNHVFLLDMDRLKNDAGSRRLAYVGITRAKYGLTLSITGKNGLAAELF